MDYQPFYIDTETEGSAGEHDGYIWTDKYNKRSATILLLKPSSMPCIVSL